MSLGKKLLELRKKAGLSQEEAADQLDVSRQTVSKWETDQTVPDLTKAKLLCELYHVSYDQLISGNTVVGDLTSMESAADEIDWTAAWSQKHLILASYQALDGIRAYREQIAALCDRCQEQFGLSETDTFLILKDILYQEYKSRNGKKPAT